MMARSTAQRALIWPLLLHSDLLPGVRGGSHPAVWLAGEKSWIISAAEEVLNHGITGKPSAIGKEIQEETHVFLKISR